MSSRWGIQFVWMVVFCDSAENCCKRKSEQNAQNLKFSAKCIVLSCVTLNFSLAFVSQLIQLYDYWYKSINYHGF